MPLGTIDGAGDSVALDVSANGSVVVGWSTSDFSSSQAFLWTQGTGMVGLGFLPGSGVFSESAAQAVSADGSTVVGNNFDHGTGDIEAIMWTLGDGMVRIGSLTGGTQRSFANDVSADGSTIVGYANSDNGIQEAFRWTDATGMVGLGDLPGGTFDSGAYGVSADGTVVVGWGQDAAGIEAMRWTEVGGMRSIAELLTAEGIDLTGWSLRLADGHQRRW